MQNNAFTPFGPTYAIDNSAAYQCLATNNNRSTAYRIRNTGSTAAYIAWALTAAGVITTAPIVGTPQGGINGGGIIGMLPNSVEVFCLPPEAYFKAGIGFTFEVTPGEGM